MKHPNYSTVPHGSQNNLNNSTMTLDSPPLDDDGENTVPLTLEKIEAKANEVLILFYQTLIY